MIQHNKIISKYIRIGIRLAVTNFQTEHCLSTINPLISFPIEHNSEE